MQRARVARAFESSDGIAGGPKKSCEAPAQEFISAGDSSIGWGPELAKVGRLRRMSGRAGPTIYEKIPPSIASPDRAAPAGPAWFRSLNHANWPGKSGSPAYRPETAH